MITPMSNAIRAATHQHVTRLTDMLGHLVAEGGPRAPVWSALRASIVEPEQGRFSHGMPHPRSVAVVAGMTSAEHTTWLGTLLDLGHRSSDPIERSLIHALHLELVGAMQVVQYKARALDEDAQRLLEDGQQE